MTATFGYLWRFRNRNIQLQLVINNLLNDRTVYWTTSTNGAATTALRPRDGNYSSPARETVPVGFGRRRRSISISPPPGGCEIGIVRGWKRLDPKPLVWYSDMVRP